MGLLQCPELALGDHGHGPQENAAVLEPLQF
jgi:hypothetical protein